MRAEYEIDNRIGFFYFFSHVLLLHHAAADGDYLVGVILLCVVQRADVAENAHLGVLAHGAGVDDDDVGLKFVLREAVAHLGEIAAQLLAVGLVLLAAVGVHHCERALAVGGHGLENFGADVLLLLYPAYIYGLSHVISSVKIVFHFILT